MIARALAILLALSAAPAVAQVRPQPGTGDARMQTVDYQSNQVVEIQGAPGYKVMIALAPEKHIQNISLGNSGAWQVVVRHRGKWSLVDRTRTVQGTRCHVSINCGGCRSESKIKR